MFSFVGEDKDLLFNSNIVILNEAKRSEKSHTIYSFSHSLKYLCSFVKTLPELVFNKKLSLLHESQHQQDCSHFRS